MNKDLVIALVGNPNCGKTSLFNSLTGAKQHVGNWPGVTVEKKEGNMNYNGRKIKIVDLPGTYSLGAYSEDEVVARNFILQDKPDVIINLVDATNIERNLYLTMQLLEINSNVVVALNMMDEAENRGIQIDIKGLSKELNVPVISTIATKKIGVEELIIEALKVADNKKDKPYTFDYGKEMNTEIKSLGSELAACSAELAYPTDWLAIKLFENDQYILDLIEKKVYGNKIINKLYKGIDNITKAIGYNQKL